MTIRNKILAGAALAATMFAANAQAATLTTGAGWSIFLFGGPGSSITDFGTSDPAYAFVLGSAATLRVTDVLQIGDVFSIYDGGSLIFTTGPFDMLGATTSDPDVAFGGSTYSWGSTVLSAGAHSITGIADASPYGTGGAYISLISGVPEPTTWALMIGGFGLAGLALRRRSAIAA